MPCYSFTKEALLSLNLKSNTDIYSYNSVVLLFIYMKDEAWKLYIEGNCYRLNSEDEIEKSQGAN